MRYLVSRAGVLCVLIGLVAHVAHSQDLLGPSVTVWNSFGPGNSYNTSVAWGVSGASTGGGYRGQAEFFTPNISGNLTTIQLAMTRSSGSGRSTFFIATDSGGVPGTILEGFTNVLSPNGILTLTSTANPLLQAGTQYWLAAEPADSTTVSGWYYDNQGYTNGFAFERSEWSWSAFTDPIHSPPSGVFNISVAPVPEPSMAGLVFVGVCLLACGRKFRSQ